MSSSHTGAGAGPRTFPPQAQAVAFIVNSAERSANSRRSRLASQAALARAGGSILRFHRVLSAFAASLIAFAPLHAAAQTEPDDSVSVRERPRPEFDPLGSRVGAFNLNAELNFGVAMTDNLFAEESGFEDEDTIFTVSPWARLSSGWSRHALSVEGGATFKSHEDFSSEDADTHFLRGVGRLDVGSSTSITGVVGAAREVESRTDPDSPLTPDPIEYDRNDLSVSVAHTFNRFRVVGEAARSEYDFDNAQNVRDSENTILRGRLEAELTPRIGAVFEASADERDYKNDPTLNSEGQTYLAGVTINFTDLMEGEFTIGQFERDYDGYGTTDGLAIAAELEWYITRLTTLTFNARRNAEDVVGGATLLPYIEETYGARVDHELLRNLILTGAVQMGNREYDVINRDDEFFNGELGADYLMNRRVALSARYRYEEVDSSGIAAYRDFEVNTFSVGLSLRL